MNWLDLFVVLISSVQSLSLIQLCNSMDCSMPGFPVLHQLPELTQTHVHWVCDAVQPSHPLSSPSPPAFNHSQYQGLFLWVSSSLQVVKVFELQLQHQSFQWIFRTDFLQDWLVWSCSPRDSQESSQTPQLNSDLNWRKCGKPLDHSGTTYIKSLIILQWRWEID